MSGSSKELPLKGHENVNWYVLGEKSKAAILRTVELSKTETHKTELSDLEDTLGLKFVVARSDIFFGHSLHRPEVYASPLPDENEFYMMCPIGDGRKDGQTSFIPKDAEKISEEKIEEITSLLFTAGASSRPIIRKAPIPLGPNDQQQENTPD